MKYEVCISGSPRTGRGPKGDRPAQRHRARTEPVTTGPGPAKRFPPVLQVLTKVPEQVEQQLRALSIQAYRQGLSLEQICKHLHDRARALGFDAVMGVQEVYSASMPSFPGATIMSALIMLDLRPVQVAQQARRRRRVVNQ